MNSFPNHENKSYLDSCWNTPKLSASRTWSAIHTFLDSLGLARANYRLNPGIGKRRSYRERYLDRHATVQEISTELDKAEREGFVIKHGSFFDQTHQQFWLSSAKTETPRFQLLSIISDNEGRYIDWSSLVEQLAKLGNLVWLGNICGLYKGWQHCSLPDVYNNHYGEMPPYRTYLLHETVTLDTSLNPGSNHVHRGEWVRADSELWLGPGFWDFAPCTKEEVLEADFFIEKRDTPNYLYLKSWPHPFTRPDGEQGRVQQKLWRLLYHQDCEWPPGSGTICDEPMYGPPELMPDYQPPTHPH